LVWEVLLIERYKHKLGEYWGVTSGKEMNDKLDVTKNIFIRNASWSYAIIQVVL